MRVCPRFVSALLAPTLPAAIIGALFAAPFVYLVIRNIQAADTFTATLTTGRALEPLARTLALGIAVSGAAAIVGTGAAWLATRTDVPGRRVWLIVLPLPLVIPSFIGAFVLIAAFAPGGLAARALDPLGITTPPVQGFAAAFTVLTLLTYPFVFLPVAARISHLPASLEESARLLGHGPLRSFFSVIMPQAASAVLAGSLLVFLYTISDFGAVQLLRFDALTRSIFSSRLLNPELALALSLQLGIVAFAIVIAERGFTRSRRRIDVRREIRALRVPLQRWRLPAAVALGALVTAALLAPAGVLIYWAVRGLVRGSTRASALVTDFWSLAEPALNTAAVSAVAAVAAVAVVLPVAYATVRGHRRAAEAAGALVTSGFALPGLVISLSLVFWALGAPGFIGAIYQTTPLLIIAYVLNFGALAMQPSQVAVAGTPRTLTDAARTLGLGRVRRFLRVELPLMRPGLLAAAGLVLLSTMKELPATLLLAPPGFQTLATKVWNATEDAFLADASLASLVLIVVSAVLTYVLILRRAIAIR